MRIRRIMNANYHDKLKKARQAIQDAEVVLIGGGAGLSASAGLVYSGERFTSHFAEEFALLLNIPLDKRK